MTPNSNEAYSCHKISENNFMSLHDLIKEYDVDTDDVDPEVPPVLNLNVVSDTVFIPALKRDPHLWRIVNNDLSAPSIHTPNLVPPFTVQKKKLK